MRWRVAPTGCWIWSGPPDSQGYGRIKVRGRTWLAHRWVYEQRYGPIAPGLVLLHACDVRACVRPDHLSEGTRADNDADRARKGRTRNQYSR